MAFEARVSEATPGNQVPHIAEFISGPRLARTRWLMWVTTNLKSLCPS